MPLIALFLAGFIVGFYRGRKRGGRTVDHLQYGVAHGFGFLVAGIGVALVGNLFGIT